MISLLQIEHLTKSFGDLLLLNDVSLGISSGQRIALIARNGLGKTTLLRMIAGTEDFDSGNITFRNGLKMAYLEQSPTFAPGLTVIDACLQSDNEVVKVIAEYEHCIASSNQQKLADIMNKMDLLQAWDFETRIKQILGKLQITDYEQPCDQLSGGQLKRVALANVLITEPDLILLDEPTNHLDLEMVEWLEEWLLRSSATLLMVTHDRYFLDRVCNVIYEIERQQLVSYAGNYSYYLEKKAERTDAYNAETVRTQQLFRKELEWMRRQPQARATKAKSRIDRFYDIEDRASQKQINTDVKLKVKAAYLGSKIFEAKYISKSYGDVVLLNQFYYCFARYEKMGIVGKNGTGKSTFLKILLGQVKPDAGSVDIGETVAFGYYSQDGLMFDESMKVIDVVREIAEEIDLGGGRKLSASQFLQHFLFTPETQHHFVYKLSGGEKRRLYLCTVLMRNPNFLILDEPTNDLDIATLNVLEEYLREFKGCVIVVTHDRYFMDKVVDHLLVFKGNAHIQDFPGNYTQYREKEMESRKENVAVSVAKATVKTQQATPALDQPVRKLSFKEKKELAELEEDIYLLEQQKLELEMALSSGTLTNNDLREALQLFANIVATIETKSERWLTLSEL